MENTNISSDSMMLNDSEDEFEVEKIIDMKVSIRNKCQILFLIRWADYDDTHDSWLPVTDLHCEVLIQDFLESSGRWQEYEIAMIEIKKKEDKARMSEDNIYLYYFTDLTNTGTMHDRNIKRKRLSSNSLTRKEKRKRHQSEEYSFEGFLPEIGTPHDTYSVCFDPDIVIKKEKDISDSSEMSYEYDDINSFIKTEIKTETYEEFSFSEDGLETVAEVNSSCHVPALTDASTAIPNVNPITNNTTNKGLKERVRSPNHSSSELIRNPNQASEVLIRTLSQSSKEPINGLSQFSNECLRRPDQSSKEPLDITNQSCRESVGSPNNICKWTIISPNMISKEPRGCPNTISKGPIESSTHCYKEPIKNPSTEEILESYNQTSKEQIIGQNQFFSEPMNQSCGIAIPTSSPFKRKENIFNCNSCSFKTKNEAVLKKHKCRLEKGNIQSRNLRPIKTRSQCNSKKHTLPTREIKRFYCDVCQYQTRNKNSLDRHVLTHITESKDLSIKESSLETCELKKRPLNLDEHISCKLCSYKTNDIGHFDRHMLTHTTTISAFSCKLCSFKTTSKETLERHRHIHTGNNHFSCDLCSFKTNKIVYLDVHKATHTGAPIDFSCKFCSFKTMSNEDLQIHQNIHIGDQEFTCKLCSYRTNKIAHLDRHKVSHTTGQRPFSCKFCSFKTTSKETLERHLHIHTAVKDFSTNEIGHLERRKLTHTVMQNTLSCSYCSFKSLSNGDLKRHILIHFGGECSYKTHDKKSLDGHKLTHTATQSAISCEYCSFKATNNGDLDRHLLIHSKGKDFSFELPSFRTNQTEYLNEHTLTHAESQNALCSYKSNSIAERNKHVTIHARESFMCCDYCSFRTNNAGHLRRHNLIHGEGKQLGSKLNPFIKINKCEKTLNQTGETRFCCGFCSYKANDNGDLDRHLIIHIGKQMYLNPFSINTDRGERMKNISNRRDKELCCELCSYRTVLSENLRIHKLIHTKRKYICCALCSYQTTDNEDMKSHVLIHRRKPFSA